ncbi:MAG: Tetratricopeptide repeat protein, partial [Pedosphaera sp.]|nr:Tetratricopeptide repeat protein [Pedosphaera sp.]
MITETESPRVRSFVTSVLPWLLGAGMLGIFLATLNRWVTPNSLNEVVDFANWSQRPHALGPVTFLITYPLRWLPVGVIPVALNVFSAVCAALVLALLGRSVVLLPHDRTHEQRQREQSEFSILTIPAAWLPPLLAVLICGLQMTFWENATEATGEMFDLLLFAYVIRCLLEYRINGRESWLIRLALAYGLGMADNWAMIGFFPAFLAAIIWIKGLGALNPRFMFQMLCCGLAGLLLIFLFPLLNRYTGNLHVGFWQSLRSTLSFDKAVLAHFPRDTVAVLALTSVL